MTSYTKAVGLMVAIIAHSIYCVMQDSCILSSTNSAKVDPFQEKRCLQHISVSTGRKGVRQPHFPACCFVELFVPQVVAFGSWLW